MFSYFEVVSRSICYGEWEIHLHTMYQKVYGTRRKMTDSIPALHDHFRMQSVYLGCHFYISFIHTDIRQYMDSYIIEVMGELRSIN